MRKLDISVRSNYSLTEDFILIKGNIKLQGIHITVSWDWQPCSLVYTGCRHTTCPTFVRQGAGGPKQRFTVEELYVSDALLHCYVPSIWVWLRLEIKCNHWSILTKCCVLYHIREDVQACDHAPWYTADSVAAETALSTQKCHIVAGSKIREMKSPSVSASHRHLQRSLDWTTQLTVLQLRLHWALKNATLLLPQR